VNDAEDWTLLKSFDPISVGRVQTRTVARKFSIGGLCGSGGGSLRFCRGLAIVKI